MISYLEEECSQREVLVVVVFSVVVVLFPLFALVVVVYSVVVVLFSFAVGYCDSGHTVGITLRVTTRG